MTTTTQDSTARLADSAAVRGYVKRVCFKTGPPRLVGTELEWLVAFEDRPGEVVPLDLLRDLLGAATSGSPLASSLTFEPGGQLELSSPALPGASACWRALDADVTRVRAALAPAGLALLPTAVDPHRAPLRQVRHPRYDAMEHYFAAAGPDDAANGPVMMTSTAATQVNLDAGASPADVARRWRLLHDAGPALVAAFANSPTHAGTPTGWKSSRQRVWQSLDPTRTTAPAGADPVDAWTAYALDARLMMLPRDGEDWTLAPGPTFRDWLAGRLDARPPTEADLGYHLTTLFPPVRPKGWFEVRYLDALPDPWWPVPAAVLAALLDDPAAGATAAEACRGTADAWTTAARDGLDDPALADAARVVLDAAAGALPRLGTDPALTALVDGFADRYTRRGCCPADDPLPRS
ncbi:MAG: ergothioneine biosynthesis glutamate--cysteine ligase EgtA [Nocardioides sp.]